jgi:hypothetical protein
MSTPMRIAAFVTALAAVFALAWGGGRVVGPVDTEPVAAHEADEHDDAHPGDAESTAPAEAPGGLSVSGQGYTVALADDRVASGPRTVSFTITGPDGEPLTDYEIAHEKRLHLIAVRRDFTGYQHVHPTMSPSGVWFADLALSPGVWRLFADFVPYGGDALTLGTDLAVAGRDRVAAASPETRTSRVAGYTVELVGELAPAGSAGLNVRVEKDGEEVTDLEPYLGAYGHLVALREGDLAYLHVHPEESGPGPDVPFVAEVPSAGRYRLFFDFQHDGVVRTAAFVVRTSGHGTEEGDSHDH